jgi:hypothetical protein
MPFAVHAMRRWPWPSGGDARTSTFPIESTVFTPAVDPLASTSHSTRCRSRGTSAASAAVMYGSWGFVCCRCRCRCRCRRRAASPSEAESPEPFVVAGGRRASQVMENLVVRRPVLFRWGCLLGGSAGGDGEFSMTTHEAKTGTSSPCDRLAPPRFRACARAGMRRPEFGGPGTPERGLAARSWSRSPSSSAIPTPRSSASTRSPRGSTGRCTSRRTSAGAATSVYARPDGTSSCSASPGSRGSTIASPTARWVRTG